MEEIKENCIKWRREFMRKSMVAESERDSEDYMAVYNLLSVLQIGIEQLIREREDAKR